VVAKGDGGDAPQYPGIEIGYVDPVVGIDFAVEARLTAGAARRSRGRRYQVIVSLQKLGRHSKPNRIGAIAGSLCRRAMGGKVVAA
jgi:hypothetical protein